MSLKKYGPFSFAMNYFRYRLLASGRHSVHSPFVYKFYTRTVKGRERCSDTGISDIIKRSGKDSSKVTYDHPLPGVGSVTTSIRKIASTASKSEKYQNLLYRVARDLKVKNGLEIGTSLGFTTLHLASARPDAKWNTLEGAKEIAELAQRNFDNTTFRNIELTIGNFENILPEVLNKCEELDFVFFDGNHQLQPTLSYFEQCLLKRSENAVFIFDDINWSSEMKQAWKMIKDHPEVVTSIDLYFLGIVFFDKSLSKQHYLLRY